MHNRQHLIDIWNSHRHTLHPSLIGTPETELHWWIKALNTIIITHRTREFGLGEGRVEEASLLYVGLTW
jgi:hypothetical protein